MNAAAILQILNVVESLFTWLTNRGLARDRALALLNSAQLESRDLTTTEVQVELDATQAELDNLQEDINNIGEN